MDRIQKGILAESRAGHDSGKLYIIIEFDKDFVYLSDGKLRCLDKLKKKKLKHVQVIKEIPNEISKALSENGINDAMIRKVLKDYNNRFK